MEVVIDHPLQYKIRRVVQKAHTFPFNMQLHKTNEYVQAQYNIDLAERTLLIPTNEVNMGFHVSYAYEIKLNYTRCRRVLLIVPAAPIMVSSLLIDDILFAYGMLPFNQQSRVYNSLLPSGEAITIHQYEDQPMLRMLE